MLRHVISNDWFTIFLILGLLCITASKFLYAHRFKDFLAVIGNSKYLKIYSRDQKFIDGFDAFLFSNSILCISIFAYISYNTFFSTSEFILNQFLKLLFGLGVLLLIKVLFERLIASLFEIDELVDAYLFQKTTFKNYSGLILYPINCILLFTIEPTKTLIYITLLILTVINLVGFFTTFKNYQKILINNIFYFILYLCALEIGPYLILYKLIKDFNA